MYCDCGLRCGPSCVGVGLFWWRADSGFGDRSSHPIGWPLTRILFILVCVVSFARWTAAQEPERQCVAANSDYWDGLAVESQGNRLRTRDSVGPDQMRPRILGRYVLLEVIFEGAGIGKFVIESDLVILPWPTCDTVPSLGSPNRILAYGRARTLREGYLHDSLALVEGRKPERFFRVRYHPPDGLTVSGLQDSAHMQIMVMDDPGPILEVHEIKSGILRGEWMDGGIAVLALPTAVGVLIEPRRGYFCAWRIDPR